MFKLLKQRLESTYSLVWNNSSIIDLIPFPARYLQFNSHARTQTNLNNYTIQARSQIETIQAYKYVFSYLVRSKKAGVWVI